MKTKKLMVAAAIVTLVVLGGVWFWLCHGDAAGSEGPTKANATRRAIIGRQSRTLADMKEQRAAAQSKRKEPIAKAKVPREKVPLPDDFSPQERHDIEAMDDALDQEDFAAVAAACEAFQSSTNPAVRLRVVESLGWFGEQALPEITPYLADPDEDVRDSALQQWESGVGEMEDNEKKGGLIEATMGLLKDREMLDEIAFHLNELPELMAVDIQVALINGDNPEAAAAAKEAYEFTTGEEYVSVDAAQKWVDENVDPDDDE